MLKSMQFFVHFEKKYIFSGVNISNYEKVKFRSVRYNLFYVPTLVYNVHTFDENVPTLVLNVLIY